MGDKAQEDASSMATVCIFSFHFWNKHNTVHHSGVLFQGHEDVARIITQRVLHAFKSMR